MKLIAYYRVSTPRQDKSGLGLEAQRRDVEQYAREHDSPIAHEFTEIESGRVNSRDALTRALTLAKLTGATLLVAKLDRLSRNAAFLLTLRDSGAKFKAVDMPDADETTVGVMAVVAQAESKRISERTRAAMAVAKSNGRKFGNPNGARALRMAAKSNTASVKSIKVGADNFAADLAPILNGLSDEGITTLQAIADALDERGFKTRRGGKWRRNTVRNLFIRLGWHERIDEGGISL